MTPSPLNMGYRVLPDRSGVSTDAPLRRKLCIYGAGLGRGEAPLDDLAWEVWALNLIPPLDSAGRMRADRWFDLHQRCAQTADDMRWIEACPFPIYVPPDLIEGVPNAVRFPLDEIEETFASTYWSCTFAYQIALAMYDNELAYAAYRRGGLATDDNLPYRWTDIGLFGMELAFGTERERTVEWACVAYWIGRAQHSGIAIHVPRQSSLGRHPFRYGFEYHEEIAAVKEYTKTVRTFAAPIDGSDSPTSSPIIYPRPAKKDVH